MQMGRDCCGSRFRFSQDEGVASVRNVGTAAVHRAAHHGPRAGPFRHPMAAGEGRRCSTTASSPSATSTALGHCGRNRPRPRTAAAAAARPTGQPGPRAPPAGHRGPPPISTLDLYGSGQPQVPAAGYRFGVELTPPPGRPPTASGPGSAAGPARRLRRLAQHRPAPDPTTEPGASSAPCRAPQGRCPGPRRLRQLREVFALVQAHRGVGAPC